MAKTGAWGSLEGASEQPSRPGVVLLQPIETATQLRPGQMRFWLIWGIENWSGGETSFGLHG
jgi:hypothetical protein